MVFLILGICCLAVGAVFFWFNNNTPVQTPIPALMLPVGFALIFFALGRMTP